MVIDAEEGFDWKRPVLGTEYTTACMRDLGAIQSIAGAYRLLPTYLLTYPVLEDADAVRELRRLSDKGACVLGLQLHTWVTPPFSGSSGIEASFAGNLDPGLEEKKLLSLRRKFIDCFGFQPQVFRAGRYGASDVTPALLEGNGFTVDTSLAPRSTFVDEGGPDYMSFDCDPFWFGRDQTLLELPLCRSVVGWGGDLGADLLRAASAPPLSGLMMRPLLTRSRAAERITLSPEGNDAEAMKRLARRLVARGQSVLSLSFHSSSLSMGLNPYIQSKADLHGFYDRLSAVLSFLADDIGCAFASVLGVPDLLVQPEPAAA
jgi:hypothetical protein